MVPAGRILPGVVAEVIRKAPLSQDKVDFAWRIAVGPAVARVSKTALDESGVLRVTATDPHWAHEVQRSSRLILSRMETLLGPNVVSQIVVPSAER